MFRGTYTALVTPFRDDEIDVDAFERLIEAQIAGGMHGIVPVGTTGESPTLSHGERHQVIELAVKDGARPLPGDRGHRLEFDPRRHRAHARSAGDRRRWRAGGRAVLQQAEPGRTFPPFRRDRPGDAAADSCSITFRAVARSISTPTRSLGWREHCPNIVAIKEASGSVERVSELVAARSPDGFTVLSGDDSLTLPFLAVGAVGVVSVASNLFPAEISELVRAFLDGKTEEARSDSPEILPVVQGPLHRTESGSGEDRARLARRDVGELPAAALSR